MIVIVQLKAMRRDGKAPIRIPFETTAYETIEALEAALQAGATIVGSQLIFTQDPDKTGPCYITRRMEKTLSASERDVIHYPHNKFIDRAAAA